jgi:hypothetical protein
MKKKHIGWIGLIGWLGMCLYFGMTGMKTVDIIILMVGAVGLSIWNTVHIEKKTRQECEEEFAEDLKEAMRIPKYKVTGITRDRYFTMEEVQDDEA